MLGSNPELVFLNVKGAQESIPEIDPASLRSLADRYDNPTPNWFLAPMDCLKILAQDCCDFGIGSQTL